MMWHRYRYCGKISVCPTETELSLVSSARSQWAVIRWPVLAVNELVVAVRVLWLASPDQFPSFFRPFPLSRFVRCSLYICDSGRSSHFQFGLRVDRCDCHNHVLIFPILQTDKKKKIIWILVLVEISFATIGVGTHDSRMDCKFWDKLNPIRPNTAPTTAYHPRICIVHPQLHTNDRINQILMPTADEWCTQWFDPPVPIVSTATPLASTLNYPNG